MCRKTSLHPGRETQEAGADGWRYPSIRRSCSRRWDTAPGGGSCTSAPTCKGEAGRSEALSVGGTSCCAQLPPALQTWPGLLPAGSAGTGPQGWQALPGLRPHGKSPQSDPRLPIHTSQVSRKECGGSWVRITRQKRPRHVGRAGQRLVRGEARTGRGRGRGAEESRDSAGRSVGRSACCQKKHIPPVGLSPCGGGRVSRPRWHRRQATPPPCPAAWAGVSGVPAPGLRIEASLRGAYGGRGASSVPAGVHERGEEVQNDRGALYYALW